MKTKKNYHHWWNNLSSFNTNVALIAILFHVRHAEIVGFATVPHHTIVAAIARQRHLVLGVAETNDIRRVDVQSINLVAIRKQRLCVFLYVFSTIISIILKCLFSLIFVFGMG